MIIRGGENIYPKELEEYLVKMGGILDAQVVGVSDEKYGEEVAAIIKVKDFESKAISAEDIYDYCKGKIANYKIPKYIKFVLEYPLTVSGKVQKFILREELEAEKKNGTIENYRVRQVR
jgi:acyl-CoA synthetase (AMP-forming)/AMP-acid ligase II